MSDDKLVNELDTSDSDPLTGEIKEALALKLNADWKRFASTVTLSEQNIERIDRDNEDLYEKCYAMLRIWDANSPFPLTKGYLKLVLRRMQRNDILKELSREIKGFGSFTDVMSEMTISTAPIQRDYSREEMRVTDLTFAHIERLRTRLDGLSSSSISGWKHLAEVLTEGDPSLKERVKGLDLHNHGGGNPALSFLNDLPKRRPLVTLGELQVLAKQLKRNDIVHFIEEELSDKKSTEIGDLAVSDKERLATYMNKNTPGINGWEMFADKYKYKYTEIKSLKATIANPCSFSPTSKLFELIQEALPDMTVEYLQNICSFIGRNDVASILEDILSGKL